MRATQPRVSTKRETSPYILKRVLHDWDDEKSGLILGQIRKAISKQSKLVLVELAILDNSDSNLPQWLDLHMMVMTGGHERTDKDFSTLLEKNGFKLNRVIPTKGKLSIIEASPR